MSISFIAKIYDFVGGTLPSHVEKGKIFRPIESQSVLVLDGFLGVDYSVLIGPLLYFGLYVIEVVLPAHVEREIHQYCRGGNFWLLRYFCQRFLAAAALSLRRVVGLT